MVSQFMARPTVEHVQCLQYILRYASGTKDMGLLYRTGVTEQLVSYADADWARTDPRLGLRSPWGAPRSP